MRARFRSVFRLAAINIALLLGVAIIAELIFGRWFSPSGVFPPRVARNVEITFDARDYYPSGTVFQYRRDRYGLRGEYEDPSKIDILAIGGSTTNELYVGEGDTWTDVLARLFREGGTPLSVVNAGIDGESTIGHIYNFDRWFPLIPGLRPRYVLAYVGINDVHLQNPDNFRYDAAQPEPLGQQMRRFARDHSALYELYRTSLGAVRAKRTRLIHGSIDSRDVVWDEEILPDTIAPLSPSSAALARAYGARVTILIERIRSMGAEAIIVTQHRASYRHREGRLIVATDGALKAGIQDYYLQTTFNGEAMESCRKSKAICIDLGAEIEFQPGDFQDYVHTTPQGSRRVGEFLYSRLKDVVR